ncbi:MAG TPA: citrate synthase [Aggregicoccus sp.]|nr:citrate synthase [Aggregicoccus sp.]
MDAAREVVASGLEGVVVAETVLSDVDGERGQLVVAGHDIEALAGRWSFEQVCGLLWSGALSPAPLGPAREAAFAQLPALTGALALPDGMDALRACVAQLPLRTAEPEAVQLTGALPVLAAAWARRQQGRAPVAPDARLGHAADYLRMVTGELPAPALADALDAYLVTVVDHGMNASTFAARLVASTGSDCVSAVTAAVGALKGPLHGGAPGPVLDMLDAIAEPSRALAWLEGELAAGRRIMGMGHRVYRVRDPRAAVLEGQVERLERAGVATGRLALARAVERAAEGVLRSRHPQRSLHANVEFYTAVLLDSVGLPRTLFTPTFAVGRVAGWCAHVQEQRALARLIRPASRYVGARPKGPLAEG